ncbi:MAG: hypothetical protein LKF79_00405 [Solobacterium sp.]|jgi:hypothetical protein|nr:hypothetical protein [Solobacterium sp.]MCH4223102.1 hypothetical protein [Solobacterium sp.]MCH4265087.1 hypothetical protein [Solobacterium sp.]
MFKKKLHIHVDTENLAVPEVEIDSEDNRKQPEPAEDFDSEPEIIYEDVAIPELHIRHHKKQN